MSASLSDRSLAAAALPGAGASRLAAQAGLVVAGSLLIAAAAHVKVPFWPVPMTLQTLAIFAIAAAYGRNLAVATLLAYLAQGAVGMPVFTGGAGLAYMAGPTGGYLAGFLVAAAMIGAAADRGWTARPVALFGAMLAGEVVILALGAAWLAVLFGAEKALAFGVGPFIAADVVKAALAAALVPALGALLARLR
ncbi:MAG: biotin transporter BioY [Phyllobacteriaceae bacterium]|nr:biotin transporter BioY [Phyllobacteriaceae bacterium]